MKKANIVTWLCIKQLKTNSLVLLRRPNSLGGIINLMNLVSMEKDPTLGAERGSALGRAKEPCRLKSVLTASDVL